MFFISVWVAETRLLFLFLFLLFLLFLFPMVIIVVVSRRWFIVSHHVPLLVDFGEPGVHALYGEKGESKMEGIALEKGL